MAAGSKSSGALTTKVASGTPYQLDPSQTLRASSALLKKISSDEVSRKASGGKTNLLEDADSDAEDGDANSTPIWLAVTTKKHMVDQRRMKPGKIIVPHKLHSLASGGTSDDLRICLITADPQRKYKDLISSDRFPENLSKHITRVLGTEKLKAKYKTYESRRQLFAEYDIFLADDRIITRLPGLLGKVFYGSGAKRPIPISLQGKAENARDEQGNKRVKLSEGGEKVKRADITAEAAAHEIERAVGAALVHLAPSTNTSVKVGTSSFSAQQIADNVSAVVTELTEKYIPKGWRNVRAIHVKGPNTAALPIWLADELWESENDVLDKLPEPVKKADKKEKKRKRALLEDGAVKEVEDETKEAKKKRKSVDSGGVAVEEKQKKVKGEDVADKAARKAALKKQKDEARAAVAA